MADTVAPDRGRRLDFRGACRYLEIPEVRLRTLVESRRVPHYSDGRLFFYTGELDAWLESLKRPVHGARRTVNVQPARRRVDLQPSNELSQLLPKKRRFGAAASH